MATGKKWPSNNTAWLQVHNWTKSENSELVMIAWWRCTITIPSPMTTWPLNTDFLIEHINTNTWVCFVLFFLCVSASSSMHMHRMAQVVSLVFICHLIHMRSWSERLSFDFDLPLYLAHLLSHSFHFFPHLKLVDNLLRIPPKESMDSFDETYLHTGYEPNAYDFKETSVEPYTELLNSPPFFLRQSFSRGRRIRWPCTRGYASWSSPST